MPSYHNRHALVVIGALLAMSACGGNGAVPSSVTNDAFSAVSLARSGSFSPDDNTSILKELKKDVLIGSTVDPNNGDTGPHALSRVSSTAGLLKKGQLLVCNFADSAGTAGKGTTIEMLATAPGSKPTTFVQSSKFEGCDGDAVSFGDDVYAAGLTSKVVEKYNYKGRPKKTYGPPIEDPLVSTDAYCSLAYAPEMIYVGDAKTGSVVKFAAGYLGLRKRVAVITGFAVKGAGWRTLGPSGIQYNGTLIDHGNKCNDTLYIVDGVDNTLVAVSTSSYLLTTGEIKVLPGGKKFTCKAKKFTCASLVYGGSPLDEPVALALLPNGNLIAANGHGGNKLVEISAAGKLLGTKTINSSKKPEIFGLLAVGTNDSNTVLYYTDTADNSVHELEH